MKRKFLFLTGLIVMSMLILSSCKKQDPTSLVLDSGKSATVSGIVYADLNTYEGGYEYAPSGTKLFFKINNSEFNANANGVTIYEVTVGSNGAYSITLPVTDEGVDITIEAEDFEYDVIYDDQGSTYNAVFAGGVMSGVTGAITNSNYIRDFAY